MLIAYAKEKTLQKEKKTVTLRTRMGDIPGNQRYLADTMSWTMCTRAQTLSYRAILFKNLFQLCSLLVRGLA